MSYRGGSTSIDTTTVTGTPSLLRAINERTVLECVRRIGPISRAQLARETALSKPTVSQALAGLQEAGLVREAGRSKGGKGPIRRVGINFGAMAQIVSYYIVYVS